MAAIAAGPRQAARYVLGLAGLYLLSACNIHDPPSQPGYFQARLLYPSQPPGTQRAVDFSGEVQAWVEQGSLHVEARHESQVMRLVLKGFPGREGVYSLGSGESYGAWGEVDGNCDRVAVDQAPPCRLSHSSRRNWGLLIVRQHRPHLISGSFSFRAHDRANPAASFNVSDGAFLVRF